uniref:Uncharacterized protein n=1 Tax=Salvator merianae TaxID=96440 RepID=A0A8D0C0Z0_SALMN
LNSPGVGLVRDLCEETTCPVCLDYFKKPVIISECGHSLCRGCLDRYCGAATEGTCPQCRKIFQRRNVGPNWQLANVVEIARKLSLRGAEGEQERVCEQHQKPKHLFCRNDKTLICVKCERKDHRSHETLLLEDAAQEYMHLGWHLYGGCFRHSISVLCHYPHDRCSRGGYAVPVSIHFPFLHLITLVCQDVPDNPERFNYWPFVLGSEEFTAGRHFWEVFVGSEENWSVGVARKTVKRKGNFIWGSEEGIWCMGKWKGAYRQSDKSTPLSLIEEPRKIRVTLNCEDGQVAFYDECCLHPASFPKASGTL